MLEEHPLLEEMSMPDNPPGLPLFATMLLLIVLLAMVPFAKPITIPPRLQLRIVLLVTMTEFALWAALDASASPLIHNNVVPSDIAPTHIHSDVPVTAIRSRGAAAIIVINKVAFHRVGAR